MSGISSITIVVNAINKGEEFDEYVLSSLQETCELVGLQVKSIAVSGAASYTTKEFIKIEDVIDVEFVDVVEESVK